MLFAKTYSKKVSLMNSFRLPNLKNISFAAFNRAKILIESKKYKTKDFPLLNVQKCMEMSYTLFHTHKICAVKNDLILFTLS